MCLEASGGFGQPLGSGSPIKKNVCIVGEEIKRKTSNGSTANNDHRRLDRAISAVMCISAAARSRRQSQAVLYVQIGERRGLLVNTHFLTECRLPPDLLIGQI